jgi:GAF domain-containing protein
MGHRMALHPPIERPELSESLTKIAGLLISEEKLDAVLELVVSLTARTVDAADGVSVTLIRNGRYTSAAYSNETTRRADAWQYATNEGPCLAAALDGKRHVARDLQTDDRWPEFAKMAADEGVRGVLSIPLSPLGEPIGTLNTYCFRPDCFSDEDVEIASLFAEQAAIVIANSVAYSSAVNTNGQLKEALDSRELIGQAKGVLMEREKCSADEAFAILKQVSQRTNRKLRQVALDVIDSIQRA